MMASVNKGMSYFRYLVCSAFFTPNLKRLIMINIIYAQKLIHFHKVGNKVIKARLAILRMSEPEGGPADKFFHNLKNTF